MSARAMSVANVIASHFPSRRMRRESRFASSAGEEPVGCGSAASGGGTIGRGLAGDPEDHGAGDEEQEPGVAVQRQADA